MNGGRLEVQRVWLRKGRPVQAAEVPAVPGKGVLREVRVETKGYRATNAAVTLFRATVGASKAPAVARSCGVSACSGACRSGPGLRHMH